MADLDELVPQREADRLNEVKQTFRDTKIAVDEATASIIPFIKNAREAANAILSVNSNGQLVKEYNKAVAALNNVSAAVEKRRQAEIQLQAQREKFANEEQKRQQKIADEAEKSAARQEAAEKKIADAKIRERDRAAKNSPKGGVDTSQTNYQGNSDTLSASQAQEALSASQREASISAQQAAAAQTSLATTTAQTTSTTQQQAKAFLDNLTVEQELIQEQLILKAQVSQTNEEIKKNTAEFSGGKKTLDEYSATSIQLTEKLALLNAELVGVNQQVKLNAQATIVDEESIKAAEVAVRQLSIERDKLNGLTQEGAVKQSELNKQINQYNDFIAAGKDKLAQQKINIGNYPTLTAELKAVRVEMEKLVKSGKAGSEEFAELSGRAKQLTSSLQQVKEATKNSGDESEKATKKINLFSRGFGFLRTLAAVIPGLGLSGIFLLIAEGAQAATEKIIDFASKSHDMLDQQKAIADIAEKTSSTLIGEAAEMETLKVRFESVTSSMGDKQEVVDELNKTFEKQIGHINGINEAEKFFRDKSEAFIKAITLRAQAAGALTVVTENAAKATRLLADPESSLNGLDKFGAGLKAFFQTMTRFDDTEFGDSFRKNFDFNKLAFGANFADKELQKLYSESDYGIKQFSELSKRARELDDAFGFDTTEKSGAIKKGRIKQVQDLLNAKLDADKKELKSQRDLDKSSAEDEIINQKAIFDDDNNSAEKRLAAYDKYEKAKSSIAFFNGSERLAEVQNQLDEIERIEGLDNSKRTDAERKLLLYKSGLLKEQKALEQQAQRDINQVYADGFKDRKAISESAGKLEVDSVLDNLSKVTEARADDYAKDQEALAVQLKNKEITKRQYDVRDAKLTREYLTGKLDDEIDYIGESIQLLQLEGTVGSEQLNALIKKYNELKTARKEAQGKNAGKDDIDNLAKENQKRKELADVAQKGVEVFNAFYSIQKAQSDARLAALDLEGKKIDENLQKTIAGINREGISQEEKNKKISAAEASAQAERERLASREAEIKRKAARADRAGTIINIIADTALAVVRALGSKPYTPANIALAALTGAIGAAQLAAALAAPIPEYAEGTDHHKGGLALFGEAGPEMVIEPGKTPYMANKPTIKPLPKGTRVIPEHKIMSEMYAMMSPQLFANMNSQKQDNSDITKRLDKWGERQVEAIRTSNQAKRSNAAGFYDWRDKWAR